jgi:hypothetical protein
MSIPTLDTESLSSKRRARTRVLGRGLLQDGNLGIGLFPEGEEILVGGERPDAGSIGTVPESRATRK